MSRRSVVQNNVKQRAVDLQATVFAPSVVDETHFPETVHEKADSRTGSANHLCQCFLTDLWDHTFRYAFFAKMGQHQKDARQPLLAGIKQLVHQVLFIPDVPCEQVCNKHVGETLFPVKRLHHCFFLDSQQCAIRHSCCSTHAERLASQRSFAEKTPVP